MREDLEKIREGEKMRSIADHFFCSLSKDLLLLLRSYLISWNSMNLQFCEPFEKYCQLEGRRSWNDFLSISNHPEWKRIRKECLMITLGNHYSYQYLYDESFRNRVRNTVIDTYHQLCLKLRNKFSEKWNLAFDSDVLTNLHCLQLHRISLPLFPSIRKVNILILSFCNGLEGHGAKDRLSDVNSLAISGDVGNLNLTHLIPDNIESLDCFRNFTCEKKLRNIRTLYVPSSNKLNFHDYHFLKELVLFHGKEFSPILLPEHLPLESLSFQEGTILNPDLSIFPNLRSLKLSSDSTQVGMDIFSAESCFLRFLRCKQLRSLNLFGSGQMILPKNFFPEYFPNLLHLSTNYSFEDNEMIIGDKIRSFAVSDSSVERIHGINPSCQYAKVAFSRCRKFDFSSLFHQIYSFNNVSRVYVHDPFNLITDVSPLVNVPHLELFYCRAIQDFSCFTTNKQKFLGITGSSTLTNNDLFRFSTIKYLSIRHCCYISDVSSLRENEYLELNALSDLENAEFYGENYRSIAVTCCRKMKTITMHGRTNILQPSRPKPTIIGLENIRVVTEM